MSSNLNFSQILPIRRTMVHAVRWLKHFITLLVLPCLLVACKKGGSGSFDILQGGGGGSNAVDGLTITDADPASTNVVIEIGDTQQFYIAAAAPLGRNMTFNWYLDNVLVDGSGSTVLYAVTGTAPLVGNHVLKVSISDEKTIVERTWTIKVNGPPSVTAVTTGTPRVSVGSTTVLTAAAVDPNGDALTYTWLLNGLPSADLLGSGNTATLTGVIGDVGPVTITAIASDGTAEDSISWNAEVNYFPMACNTLTQGRICTYGGNPSVGDDENPLAPVYDIRIQPIAQTQDSIGNIFIADYGNSVVWYWNRTASPVSRVGITIPANTFTVVAGTGELATSNDGLPALTAAINRPRAVWYNDATGVLYIAEYSGNRVRYVDSSGTIFTGMGAAASNVDGATAFTHACNSPSSFAYYNNNLYVACYGGHRVKRWDLLTDLAYTFYGNGTNTISANGTAPAAGGAANPYSIFVTADGMYIAHMAHHRIRFVNFSGVGKTFWATTPSAITVNNNTVSTIVGTGIAGNVASGNSTAIDIGSPSGLVVIGDLIYFNIRNGNADRFYVANNSLAAVNIATFSVPAKTTGRISNGTAGYNGSGNALNLATINEPYDMTVDILDPDVIIFSDYGNNRMRYLTLDTHEIYDLVGSGNLRGDHYGDPLFPTLQHYFNNTNGIDYEDSTRTLLFVDQNNNRIRSVTPYGEVQTVLGIGYGMPTIDNEPPTSSLMATSLTGAVNLLNGLHILPDRSVAFVNSRAHNVRVWNRSGASANFAGTFIQNNRVSSVAGDFVTGAGNGPNGPALSSLMSSPSDIVSYDNAGNLEMYIVDQTNHCIRMLDHLGTLTSVLGTCGTLGNSGNDVLAGALLMNRPNGLAIDSLGNMVITDTFNDKIRYWNRTAGSVSFAGQNVLSGHVVTIACVNGTVGSSTENVLATTSRCANPMGIDVNATSICFAQYGRHNVRCINVSDGRINTVAGCPENNPRAGSPLGFEQEGVPGTSAVLYNPVDVVFDASGDLFISDRNNHIIRKLKLSP